MWNSFDMISSSGHKKRVASVSKCNPLKTHLRLRCNRNITNRNIIVIIGDYGLWTSVEPSSFNRTLCSPINKLCQSHKSFFQFFLICNFFFFAEILWGFILPPAVSLSRILWELDLRSRKDPPLRIAKKSLIVSWWSWWESHPCLKSYWTTSRSPYGENQFGYI